MDNNNPNINNTDEPTTLAPEQSSQPDKPKFGPMIGILIIVALLLFGGLYFWGSYLQDNPTNDWSNSQDILDYDPLSPAADTGEEYTMTEEEFDTFIGADASAASAADAGAATEAALNEAIGDLGDLDALDAEFSALESEF